MKAHKAVQIRIMQLCEERGITLNKLATIAGIRQSTLSDIIHDRSRNTGVETIERICVGLEISVYDFFNSDLFKE